MSQTPLGHDRMTRAKRAREETARTWPNLGADDIQCENPLTLTATADASLAHAMHTPHRPFVIRGHLSSTDLGRLRREWARFVSESNNRYRTNQGPKTDRSDGGSTHSVKAVRLRDMWDKPVRIETLGKGNDDPNPVIDWMKSSPPTSVATLFETYQLQLKSIVDRCFGDVETVEPAFVTGAIRPGGCTTHFDEYDNMALVVLGRKTFFITAHENITKRPKHNEVDDTPFDGVEREWLRVELLAGDALYLPAGWWHYVESVPHTVMTNYWKYRSMD